jgi:serine/threonine-protein kinase
VSDITGEIIDGRYQLQKLVAAGGMASIYVAMDLRLDRLVAVKIMHPHLANDEEFVTRFIKEAKATASLSHPNVVSIQDQGWNEGGTPAVFIVMEYIEGNTLRDYLYERGKLSLEETLRFLVPVVSALAEAHRIGIIHRDIKPENILISKDGRVKIADFGLARGDQLGSTQTAESSVVLGSVSYLSPEQVQRGISDARSDIYALGVVLFELLTGKKPYDGETPIQIAYKHVNERIPSILTIDPDLSPGIDVIIEKSTSPNPDQRYKNAAELLSELRTLQEEIDPRKRQLSLELDLPLPAPSRGRRTKSPRGEVRIGTQVIERMKNLTQPIAAVTSNTSTSRLSHTAEVRRKVSKRVKRNRAIALLIVAGLLGGGWYQFIGPGSQISIPSVVGATTNAAKQELASLGFNVDITAKDFSEDVDKGLVMQSVPGGGGHLPKGSTVHLIISKGKERILIPQVAGLAADAATALIINSGLKIGNTSESFDSKIAKGLIAATNPVLGTPVRRNSIVDLVISKGIEQVALPSYVGKNSDQASNELNDAGFAVKIAYAWSETVLAGNVIRQEPAATESIDKGATVMIVISRGTQFAFVPNVFALSENAARTALENLQLKVAVKKIGTKANKKVTGISPKVGTQVKRGSVVTITLS